MDADQLSEIVQPSECTSVPVQYSLQQPVHRQQGFKADIGRTQRTGSDPLDDQYGIHGGDVYDPHLYHSIHGGIRACKKTICRRQITLYFDRMRNGITETGNSHPFAEGNVEPESI